MNKNIDYYLNLPYRMEITPDIDEGGYVVSYPELVGCLSQGETIEEAINNAQEAKKEWLLATLEDGMTIPKPQSSNKYSGTFKLRIPKSLHQSLAKHAKNEGISMNQYILYLLTKNDSEYNLDK